MSEMSNENQETIADIVREMRTLGRLDEKSTDKMPRSLQALGLRTYADRIEAAAKREREAGANKESLHVGNAAAMREALLRCDAIAQLPEIREYIIVKEMRNLIKGALSAPPRNCDVLSDKQEALAAIHEDRGYVNNPIDERRLTVNWLFAEAKGETK